MNRAMENALYGKFRIGDIVEVQFRTFELCVVVEVFSEATSNIGYVVEELPWRARARGRPEGASAVRQADLLTLIRREHDGVFWEIMCPCGTPGCPTGPECFGGSDY